VILFHILSKILPSDILSLFSTYKFFHEMIGYPTAADHRRWNLELLDHTFILMFDRSQDAMVRELLTAQLESFLRCLNEGAGEGAGLTSYWYNAIKLRQGEAILFKIILLWKGRGKGEKMV
jgi:hypothetical protein